MKKENKQNLYSIWFIIGLIMMIWQVDIYRVTIIELWIPIFIIISSGTLAFLFDFRNYVRIFTVSGIYLYIYSAVFYIVGCGFIVCSMFMISNYHISTQQSIYKSYKIIEKTSLPGRRRHRAEKQLLVKIKYDNILKEMVFNHYHYKNRELYDSVEVEIRNGLFGFDVFYETKLK